MARLSIALWSLTSLVACEAGTSGDCPVGGLDCSCTLGGSCDPGLSCVDGTCRVIETSATEPDPSSTSPSSTTNTTSSTTDDPMTSSTNGSSGSSGGLVLDVSAPDVPTGPTEGCQAIDMLFAIDGSASMNAERAALAATGAFTQVITTLEGLHKGNIRYRIAVTDDDDTGYFVPPGWAGPSPWFDSEDLDAMEIATAFNGAVGQIASVGGASTGCEHVLTSATHLIDGNELGFVRDDALLVLVLLTDVDDYGAYDQQDGNSCGFGCTTPPTVLTDLYDALVELKGTEAGVSAIVVAGDPASADGFNFCDQPGSCGCGEVDCDIFHATRLYDFAGMLGTNGWTGDLCDGASSVPMAIETALTESIEIACENFDPEG
jgi:hypothetical protein